MPNTMLMDTALQKNPYHFVLSKNILGQEFVVAIHGDFTVCCQIISKPKFGVCVKRRNRNGW